ncbi:MAG: hypothetical protein Ta2F_05140 [Termitinemataceae bacterium]|nr:MAG: hypothetical protein Ta2F_05140 [Termitinemataceae bacterium]
MNKYIPKESVEDQKDDYVLLKFSVPSTSPFFDGHFPNFKLLPAVVQFELVMRYADRYFHCGIEPKKIKRIKFSDMIKPNDELHMELTYNKIDSKITFVITSPDKSKTYSKGGIQL